MSAQAKTRVEVAGWMIAAVLLTIMAWMLLFCPDDETLRVDGPHPAVVTTR